MNSETKTREVATFGGGCFWCLDAVFADLKGVESSISGYSGGAVDNPTYREVCSGTTGHAEVSQVTYDPSVITFRELLEVFFTIHDPTTLNRQGADEGPQYRSVIFYHTPEQKAIAEQIIKEFSEKGIWDRPIVTEVTPFQKFYRAEEYHQDYYKNNPGQGYCRIVIAPKVAKARKQFIEKLKR
ncbi:MAG: peptide-methionine (S)-S-oxide reductase MsrA [Candidatus Manganitrophus sp.]|nr:peptide-methionine (S)-S-oxide reductase MsrA [Candidatus Manganitrophus sp.]